MVVRVLIVKEKTWIFFFFLYLCLCFCQVFPFLGGVNSFLFIEALFLKRGSPASHNLKQKRRAIKKEKGEKKVEKIFEQQKKEKQTNKISIYVHYFKR